MDKQIDWEHLSKKEIEETLVIRETVRKREIEDTFGKREAFKQFKCGEKILTLQELNKIKANKNVKAIEFEVFNIQYSNFETECYDGTIYFEIIFNEECNDKEPRLTVRVDKCRM